MARRISEKNMHETHIKTLDSLKDYLRRAIQLEHATIPPYLTALYSIHPGTNSDAVHILRVVVVEEMLHLTLAANLLNAVGGRPDLTAPGFVPLYPSRLPDGEKDFEVSLERFSMSAIETFLKIERPAQAPDESKRRVRRKGGGERLCASPIDPEVEYYSIGEFYEEIWRGFKHLHAQLGDGLFSGDPACQVTAEYYYSGGGALHAVTNMASAEAAIHLITRQGEGKGGGIYDSERELAHYYRFDQLKKGRYYQTSDQPHEPTGPELRVDWDAVYPLKTNARVSDYRDAPELHAAAEAFNRAYGEFLAMLTLAFNGQPAQLMQAVPQMFRLRNGMLQLMHNPHPQSSKENAAPTFEVGGRK